MAEVPDNPPVDDLLEYLQRIPGYPFDAKIDPDFAGELLEDFAVLDVLEEVKAFRWYHDNEPTKRVRHLRLGLRRWLAGTLARRSQF